MKCTICYEHAVVHFVGHHPQMGYASTGIARCARHQNYGIQDAEFVGASLGRFFERINLDDSAGDGA